MIANIFTIFSQSLMIRSYQFRLNGNEIRDKDEWVLIFSLFHAEGSAPELGSKYPDSCRHTKSAVLTGPIPETSHNRGAWLNWALYGEWGLQIISAGGGTTFPDGN